MEVVGAVAAISQILTQTAKSAKLARDVYNSFQNAPEELRQVGQKLVLVRARVEQIQELGRELSNTDMDHLFPENRRVMILAALESSTLPMNEIRSLKASARQQSSRARRSWAAVDKTRAIAVLHQISETNSVLDSSLQILAARLNTMNYTSLDAIKAGQDALHASKAHMESSIADLREGQARSIMKLEETVAATDAVRDLLCKTLVEHQNFKAQQEERFEKMTSWMMQQNLSSPEGPKTNASHESRNPFAKERNTVKERAQHNWIAGFRTKKVQLSFRPEPHHSVYSRARVQLTQNVRGRRTATQIKIYLRIFGHLIIHTELCFRSYANTWFPVTSISSSISTINIRPRNAPIFSATQGLDLKQVTRLLEDGQASIHDVAGFEGYTLVGILIRSLTDDFEIDMSGCGQEKRERTNNLLSYLVREGCDPNTMSQTAEDNVSLLAYSLSKYRVTVPRMLFMHGADPEQSPLIDYLTRIGTTEEVQDQVQLLKSWGVLDWRHAEASYSKRSLLTSYCSKRDARPMIRAIRDDGLDVNYTSTPTTPLEMALGYGSLEVAAVLVAYGATVHFNRDGGGNQPRESPLAHVLRTRGFNNAHFLLFHGASPGNTWHNLFGWSLYNDHLLAGRFSWDYVVGVALHMLFHNASCHFSHADVAHLEPIPGPSRTPYRYTCNEQDADPELNATEQRTTLWTEQGVICLDSYDLQQHLLEKRKDMGRGSFSKNAPQTKLRGNEEIVVCGSKTDNQEDFTTNFDYDREIPHQVFWDAERNGARRYLLREKSDLSMCDPNFTLNDKFGFRRLVSSSRGRRRLTRWPLAAAYCKAVQLAGYRAEMDDDGDIWWSDDDGDRYVDAREEQPIAGGDDCQTLKDCPICQEPAGWGLKEFRLREEEGLRQIRESDS